MARDFPELSDIRIPIEPPFEISSEGDWLAIGIGDRGLILRHESDPGVLRHLGQVVKFCPQRYYLAAETITALLKERGIEADWQAR